MFFKNAGLLPRHDYKTLKNHLYGRYKGTAFDLAECYLSKAKNDGSDNPSSKTVFSGIFIAIVYPYRITGKTLISADSGIFKIFKDFFKGIFGSRKIELGHSGLDDHYSIYTTDEEEARKLISPHRVGIMALVEQHWPRCPGNGLYGRLPFALSQKRKRQLCCQYEARPGHLHPECGLNCRKNLRDF